jgi:hypothetical protein
MVMDTLTDKVATVLWMLVKIIARPTMTVIIRDIEMRHRVTEIAAYNKVNIAK